MFQDSSLYPFLSIWRTSFFHSWRLALPSLLNHVRRYISPSFLKDSFAQCRIHNWQMPLRLKKIMPPPFGLSDLRWEICFSNWCSFTVNVPFLFDSFKILPFSLVFINLILYLGMDFCGLMSFAKFRISAIISLRTFSALPLLFCFLDGNYMNIGSFLSSSHRRSSVYLYFLSTFPICCSDWINSIITSLGSLILFSLNSILLFSLYSEIKKNYYYFSVLWFLFASFL